MEVFGAVCQMRNEFQEWVTASQCFLLLFARRVKPVDDVLGGDKEVKGSIFASRIFDHPTQIVMKLCVKVSGMAKFRETVEQGRCLHMRPNVLDKPHPTALRTGLAV